MRSRTTFALAGAAALVAVAALTSPAGAAYNYADGSCKDGDSNATFETAWRSSGGYKSAVTYGAYLNNKNGLGNKSNVRARHYRNVNNASDKLLQDFNSPDNVRPNINNVWAAASGARVTTSQTAHTRYDIVFDNSGTDDACHNDTSDF